MEIQKSRTVLFGLALAAGLSFAAGAGSDDITETGQSEQDMSVEEAADNFVDDAEKVGDKAVEVGEDIAEETEDAYEDTKEAVQDASE